MINPNLQSMFPMYFRSIKCIQFNANKSNHSMHAILTKETSSTDIIIFQEPWWGRIGARVVDNISEDPTIKGTVNHPDWIPFLPFQNQHSRKPRAITFVHKSFASQWRCNARPDICSNEDVQVLELRHSIHNETFFLFNVYHDQARGPESAIECLKCLMPNGDTQVILAGDFNTHHPSWSLEGFRQDSHAQSFVDWMIDNNLSVLNSKNIPTFFHRVQTNRPSVIDLTITNQRHLISDWNVDKEYGSDHVPVSWCINRAVNLDFDLPGYCIKSEKREDWSKAFEQAVNESFPSSDHPNFVDQAAECLQAAMVKASDLTLSHIRIRSHSKTWWNDHLDTICSQLKIARGDHQLFQSLQDKKRKLIRTTKQLWIQERLDQADGLDIWQMATWYKGIRRYKIPSLSHGD